MISNAEQARHDAYNAAVEALHRVNPKAEPIVKFGEPFSIARVSDQARHAVAPVVDHKPTPEAVLITRSNNIGQAIAELVAEAKRKGVPVDPPPPETDRENINAATLKALNDYHFRLEKRVEYYDKTTMEQRAIDELRGEVGRLKKAMVALNNLLPLMMTEKRE